MRKAVKILAEIIEDDEDFEERMDAYVKADGEVPKDFLDILENARRIWHEIKEGTIPDDISDLPSYFQEAIVELTANRKQADRLVELKQKVSDKAVVKAIRKALHILRNQGIEVPETETKRTTARLQQAGRQKPNSLATLPLSDGSQEVFLIAKHGREFTILSALIYHGEGIRDFGTFAAGKAAIRDLKQKLEELQRAPVEIPYERAYAMIERALAWHDEKGTAPPQGFISELRRWEKPKQKGQLNEQTPENWEELLPKSAELLDHPPFDRWALPWEEERKFEIKINEIYTSQVIPTEEKKFELIKEKIDQTVDEFFGERREFFAGLLAEAAELLNIAGKGEFASLAAAVSRALKDSNMPPSRIPFLRGIMSRRLLLRTPEGTKSFDEIESPFGGKQAGNSKDDAEGPGGLIVTG